MFRLEDFKLSVSIASAIWLVLIITEILLIVLGVISVTLVGVIPSLMYVAITILLFSFIKCVRQNTELERLEEEGKLTDSDINRSVSYDVGLTMYFAVLVVASIGILVDPLTAYEPINFLQVIIGAIVAGISTKIVVQLALKVVFKFIDHVNKISNT